MRSRLHRSGSGGFPNAQETPLLFLWTVIPCVSAIAAFELPVHCPQVLHVFRRYPLRLARNRIARSHGSKSDHSLEIDE
jgi:hypothetical protein